MALLLSMSALVLLTSLGGAMMLATVTETAVAASYRAGIEAFYAAEASVEFAVLELAARPDWAPVLAGEAGSAFADGPPTGVRPVGPTLIDLAAETADVAAMPGSAGLSYELYAYGPAADLISPAGVAPKHYVVVWVADLGSRFEIPAIRILARAYGPNGPRRSVVVSLARSGRVLTWSEIRQ